MTMNWKTLGLAACAALAGSVFGGTQMNPKSFGALKDMPVYIQEWHVWWGFPYPDRQQPFSHMSSTLTAEREPWRLNWNRNGYPLVGLYDAANPEIMRWQIRCMKAARAHLGRVDDSPGMEYRHRLHSGGTGQHHPDGARHCRRGELPDFLYGRGRIPARERPRRRSMCRSSGSPISSKNTAAIPVSTKSTASRSTISRPTAGRCPRRKSSGCAPKSTAPPAASIGRCSAGDPVRQGSAAFDDRGRRQHPPPRPHHPGVAA